MDLFNTRLKSYNRMKLVIIGLFILEIILSVFYLIGYLNDNEVIMGIVGILSIIYKVSQVIIFYMFYKQLSFEKNDPYFVRKFSLSSALLTYIIYEIITIILIFLPINLTSLNNMGLFVFIMVLIGLKNSKKALFFNIE